MLVKLIGLSRQRRGGAGRAVGLGWGDGVGEVWGRHREDTGKTQGGSGVGSVRVQGRSDEGLGKVRC